MLLIGFLWLLYAQVALAAGKSYAFEIVLSYLGYVLQRRMYGDAQKFLFPLKSPISGEPIPANTGPNGKGLSFPGFVRLYLDNPKITVVNVELDLDNPVRTGELLLSGNYNGIAKVPYMKGVNTAKKDKVAQDLVDQRLKDYKIFTEDLTETYDLAAKTFGTGSNSPVYKELAAFEPLVARIRQERLSEMRMAKIILRDMAAAFKGMDPKTTTYKDPIDLFSDKEGRTIIKEYFGLQGVPDNDPRIKAELMNWLDGIGFMDEPTNKKAPPYSNTNRRHLFVLNGWNGMEDHLRCQAKKYLG